MSAKSPATSAATSLLFLSGGAAVPAPVPTQGRVTLPAGSALHMLRFCLCAAFFLFPEQQQGPVPGARARLCSGTSQGGQSHNEFQLARQRVSNPYAAVLCWRRCVLSCACHIVWQITAQSHAYFSPHACTTAHAGAVTNMVFLSLDEAMGAYAFLVRLPTIKHTFTIKPTFDAHPLSRPACLQLDGCGVMSLHVYVLEGKKRVTTLMTE